MCIVEDSSCDFKDVNSLVFIGLIAIGSTSNQVRLVTYNYIE